MFYQLSGDYSAQSSLHIKLTIRSVQFSHSVVSDSLQDHEASLSITNSQSSPKLMSIESVMPSNHLILHHPLLLLPPIFPSIRVFSNESALRIRWSKYWSFSFNISPSNEHPGLISFRMDWLDLLAVQETLKSLLQHQSSKASILLCSAFFVVQLSHPYMTTGKTIALTAAAAAKLLQSCPTLCDPIDGSPPGSPISGILKARTLEWAAISFSKAWKWKVKVKSLSLVWLFATPCTAAYQAPPWLDGSISSSTHIGQNLSC